MPTLTRTYTKTYALMDAWAETLPWDCARPDHDHDPMVGDTCSVPDCREPLRANEVCYAVTQLETITAPPSRNPNGRVRQREQWVCWRHVRPDDGPITTTRPEAPAATVAGPTRSTPSSTTATTRLRSPNGAMPASRGLTARRRSSPGTASTHPDPATTWCASASRTCRPCSTRCERQCSNAGSRRWTRGEP